MRGVPRERQRDLLGRVGGDLDAEDARRAMHDRAELAGVVVVEPERHAEAVAQRRRQQAGARRRADQRERRQVERQRARGRALAHDDVDAEVLERRVEDLLGGAAHAVDLVDEEHVARLERREDRRDVLLLDRRAGDRADADAELLANDVREARLAEARRAGEQHVVERLAARLRRASARSRAAPSRAPARRTRRAAAAGGVSSSSSSSSSSTGATNELMLPSAAPAARAPPAAAAASVSASARSASASE